MSAMMSFDGCGRNLMRSSEAARLLPAPSRESPFPFRSPLLIASAMDSPPLYPALYATHGGIWIASPAGEVRGVGRGEAIALAAETPMIMLNAPLVGQRLG